MTYILIFLIGTSKNYQITTATAEFNTLPACVAAAKELRTQVSAVAWPTLEVRAIMCAGKGSKP